MAKDKEVTQEEKIEKVKEIIDDTKIALITTVGESGLVSRPMAVQEVEPGGDLWFMTFKDSSKIQQINNDDRVNVSFNDKNQNFVSITGHATLVNDSKKEKELLNSADKALFETDNDDPNLILLKVEALGAEYWESDGKGKVVVEFVAKLLGKKGTDLGENESVNLD